MPCRGPDMSRASRLADKIVEAITAVLGEHGIQRPDPAHWLPDMKWDAALEQVRNGLREAIEIEACANF